MGKPLHVTSWHGTLNLYASTTVFCANVLAGVIITDFMLMLKKKVHKTRVDSLCFAVSASLS